MSANNEQHVEFDIGSGPDRLEFVAGLAEGLVRTTQGMRGRVVLFGLTNGPTIDVRIFSIGTIDEAWVRLELGEFSFRARVDGDRRDTEKLLARAFEHKDQREMLARRSTIVAGRYNPYVKVGRLWVSDVHGAPIKPAAPGAVIWELTPDPDTGTHVLA